MSLSEMGLRKWLFYEFLILIIVLGTAIDVFWTVMAVDYLYDVELNPIARAVIRIGDSYNGMLGLPYQGVALLCFLKVLGTWTVLRFCQWLVKLSPKFGWPVLTGVAGFQLWLAYFLLWS